jgi:signal transduction histidine kinase
MRGNQSRYATPVWRALIVFRAAALAYAVTLVAYHYRELARPGAAVAALAVMAAWTVAMSFANGTERGRRWSWSLLDLAVVTVLLLLTPYVDGPHGLLDHSRTLTGPWPAAPVLSLAILGGPWLGLLAALVIVAATVALPGGFLDVDTIDNLVLLMFAAGTVGLVVRLLDRTERRMRLVVEREAAIAERDRLARSIHDGVLQVLALVQRYGPGLGGRGTELARLAGAQEASLRALMTGDRMAGSEPVDPRRVDLRRVDLRQTLGQLALPVGRLAVPATPVLLEAHAAAELTAAVAAAVDNAHRHAGPGATTWVSVEDDPDGVVVVVRDDGCGILDGRLAEAAAAGRLGVAQSIRGRIADLGGTVTISSRPGEGTEVECRIPR